MAGQRLFCFAMERRANFCLSHRLMRCFGAPPENSRRTAIAAAPQPVSWIASEEGRAGPARLHGPAHPGIIIPIPSRPSSTTLETRPVGLVQLINNPLAKHRWPMLA